MTKFLLILISFIFILSLAIVFDEEKQRDTEKYRDRIIAGTVYSSNYYDTPGLGWVI
jgi:hypothetical protein